jgi:Tfp pilus assembly protein FimT
MPQRRRRSKRTAGFTLAEALAGVSAFATLAAVGSLSLGAFAGTFSLDNGTHAIAMALNQARVYAITRGHAVNVAFTSHGYTTTDTEGSQVLLAGTVSSTVTIATDGVASFTPLGTVTAPRLVTLSHGTDHRSVSVGLTGDVTIQ